MEIGLETEVPTYSGGLGILAGDFASSLADAGWPAVFVTLLYRKGYTLQKLDRTYGQLDSDAAVDPARYLKRLDTIVELELAGKSTKVAVWEYRVKGKVDVPVFFLDTFLPENDEATREISGRLYGGDSWHRLLQEMVLGVGGSRALKALGYQVSIHHLNESHAAFLALELMREYRSKDEVRKRCVFTTHTPIAAGYDVFPLNTVKAAFARYDWINWEAEATDGRVELAKIALRYSAITNAVSLKHRYVSEGVLNHKEIEYVTNGIYHRRWVHERLRRLFDKYLPGWEETPDLLRGAFSLPTDELSGAHAAVKAELLELLQQRGARLERDHITIGLAKRVTGYKRNNLILSNPSRLASIANSQGPIQLIFAGKTHPSDDVGKAMVRDILAKTDELKNRTDKLTVVYLENYDIKTAKTLVAGCDVWLNNPRKPLEACGTSGMKAGMNGVLNFSVYDGWWLEGGIEGVNGWGIGKRADWRATYENSDAEDLEDIYNKLAYTILPLYYQNRGRWWELAKASIATIGPQFNSYRMVEDYIARVYSRLAPAL